MQWARKFQKLEKIADEYENLKVRYDKLEGELAMRSVPSMESFPSEPPAKKEGTR